MLLLRQRFDIDLLLRLMAQEVRIHDHSSQAIYRNDPADKAGYEMFRKVVLHLSAIQDQNQLQAEPLSLEHSWTLPVASVSAEGFHILEKTFPYSMRLKRGCLSCTRKTGFHPHYQLRSWSAI